jgi:UTP--glucose-1-phosphate uridylyltransferase
MKAIIPAAGLGTRFLPWSKACPKEMLPLLDKPVIQWAIEELLKADITEVIIVVSKGKEAIVNYFTPDMLLDKYLKENKKDRRLSKLEEFLREIDITFVYQKGPYGNASPVISAKKHIPSDEPFLVMWADEFILSNPPWIKQVLAVHQESKNSVISGLRMSKEELGSKGVADLKPIKGELYQIRRIVEKPKKGEAPSDVSLVGAYLLTPDIWPCLDNLQAGKDGELWLPEAIDLLCQRHTVLAKVIKNGKFLDVGTKQSYYKAWKEVLNGFKQ